MIKKFASYYKPHLKLFIIDLVCALIVSICELFYPLIAKNIINDYVPNQNLRLLITWSVVLLGIYILKAIMNFIITYWGHIVGVKIQADMRKEMFEHLQKLPFKYFDETKTGTIMSRVINDLAEISELAHHGPEDLFLSIIMLVGSFIMLVNINVTLTLIVFAFVPFIVFFAILMRASLSKASMKSRETIAEVNANVETSISGIRVSKAYTSNEHEIVKFDTANKNFKKARYGAYKVMAQFYTGMSLQMDILYLVVLFVGGLFFLNHQINAGEFAAYLLYINNFLKPIQKLVNIYEQIQDGMTGFKRFNEIMDAEEEKDDPNATEVGVLKGDIQFHDVSFKYKNDRNADMVINHLSIEIQSGKTIALVGPSGGGKSTICHLIPRFYEVNSGYISIDGIDIKEMTRYSLRKNIGIVDQDVFLFNGTIKENIAYGNLEATDEEIMLAAQKANIHDYILTLSDGYDTNVGERGIKLSGGQKQRISIARVFLKNPAILILDEATSALDNATEMQIQQALEQLSQGRTSLIVAHRLSTIKNADEIIVIDNRGIVERGSHLELLQQHGLYAELYQYQFKEMEND